MFKCNDFMVFKLKDWIKLSVLVSVRAVICNSIEFHPWRAVAWEAPLSPEDLPHFPRRVSSASSDSGKRRRRPPEAAARWAAWPPWQPRRKAAERRPRLEVAAARVFSVPTCCLHHSRTDQE